MINQEDFLTVSELNQFIRDVLTSGFPQAVWVCGEIQELRDKKHLYFTLSEKDPTSSAITAKIGATIWANTRPKIEAVLSQAENSFFLKDDIQVKLLCKVDFYPPFGQVRLIVEAIDPAYTLGKIAQDKARLIALLKQKGVLEKNKQLTLPLLPLSIGLITSYDSAAFHDFVDELRKSGYAFSVKLVDSLMQGKESEKSVTQAIKLLNHMGGIDVIVITRGGGSVAELSAFDSAMIAEAIAESKLAVISGIGHEINTTITDLAAHTFAKTPTAIAGFLIGRIEEFLEVLQDKQKLVVEIASQRLQGERHHIKNQAMLLRQNSMAIFRTHQTVLTRFTSALKHLPLHLIKNKSSEIHQIKLDLKRTIQLRLQSSKAKIQGYQKIIDVVSPRNMLNKGFSITRDANGSIVKSVKGLKPKGVLSTQFNDGIVQSDIKEIRKGKYEF